jgi:hypothetical protein
LIFQYEESADSLWVSLSEPAGQCVYIESQTPGIILRIEEGTGIIRGFEVLAWKRRIAAGNIMIPEIVNEDFQAQWIKNLPQMRAQK